MFPEQLQQCFLKWIESISQITFGEIVAVDGKTLRHSYDSSKGKSAIHMVSAWATTNGLVLGHFISSINAQGHKSIALAIRKHWCVENQLHWVLDVSFNEDDSRIRKDNAPENKRDY